MFSTIIVREAATLSSFCYLSSPVTAFVALSTAFYATSNTGCALVTH